MTTGIGIPAFGKTEVFVSATKAAAPEPFNSMGIDKVPVSLTTEPQKSQMTVKNLLTHTAGLGYCGHTLPLGCFDDVDLWYILNGFPISTVAGSMYGSSEAYNSLEGVCNVIAGLPLKFQPGTRLEYGIGHILCGRIVEVLTGMDYLSYLEQAIFAPLGMETASFGEDAASNPNVLKLYAYGPNEMAGVKWDLAGPSMGNPIYKTAETGYLVEVGSTVPAAMHVDHCKRPEYIRDMKAKKAPIMGDAGLTGTTDDYFKFMCMLVNKGVGGNGARILGAKSIELMFKNHLPGGKSIAEMENSHNSLGIPILTHSLPGAGMGWGLGGVVPIGDAHQVEDGILAMPEGSYSWAGVAGTDVIIDPANDLAMMFTAQVMLTGFNSEVNGMMGCSKYSHFVMTALK